MSDPVHRDALQAATLKVSTMATTCTPVLKPTLCHLSVPFPLRLPTEHLPGIPVPAPSLDGRVYLGREAVARTPRLVFVRGRSRGPWLRVAWSLETECLTWPPWVRCSTVLLTPSLLEGRRANNQRVTLTNSSLHTCFPVVDAIYQETNMQEIHVTPSLQSLQSIQSLNRISALYYH